jgi:hypothetical protein
MEGSTKMTFGQLFQVKCPKEKWRSPKEETKKKPPPTFPQGKVN